MDTTYIPGVGALCSIFIDESTERIEGKLGVDRWNSVSAHFYCCSNPVGKDLK